MPIYSDANYYYTGGSSQLFAPYYPAGVYSIPSVSSAYAPYTSSYNRSFIGNYTLPISPTPRSPSYTTHTHGLSSRYQPKLSTIGETSPLITSARHNAMLPLTRIHSPKISSYSSATSLHSKYIPPRPIKMNTADIDVSAARQRKHEEEGLNEMPTTDKREEQPQKKSSIIEEQTEPTENKAMRSTIKRNRPIVRLSTVRARNKDSPKTKTETEKNLLQDSEKKMGWREKMAEDLALLASSQTKKSPGQLLRERHLIQDAKTKQESEELMREVVVEVDAVNQICHVSMPSGPTFHDICEDISSDKIDDDLNAGKLRKRASIIQEHEHQLLNQLQQSASGSFQLIHLERRASHDNNADETHQLTTSNMEAADKQNKKIKHKITAIVDVENAPLTPIQQERDEELLSPMANLPNIPKISYNINTVEEHHEVHKIFKLPKKKSIRKSLKSENAELPAGFVQAIPKAKRGSKHIKPKKYINNAEIFTFDNQTIQQHHQSKEQKNIFSLTHDNQIMEDVVKSREEAKNKSTAIEKSNNSKTINLSKLASETKPTKATDNALKQKSTLCKIQATSTIEKNLEKVTEEPIATPKPIRKCIKKSESGEDFWAHIGTRETIYMANRKNILEQFTQPKVEVMSEPSNLTETLQKHNLQTQTKYIVHKTDILQETMLPKVEIMCEASKIQESKIIETEQKHAMPKVTQESKTLTEQQNRKSKSFREETKLKVENKRAKSVETDNIMNKPCQTKNAAITTETTTKMAPITKGIMPKIQTGKEAKSPEKKQQETQQKISPKATKTTAVTIATKIMTTTTAVTTTATTSNEYKNKCMQNVKNMNNTTITAKNSKFDATTTSTTIPRTTSTTQTKPITTTMTPAATAEKPNLIKSIAEVEKKLNATTMKTTSHALNEESTTKGFEINKAKTSPINADGFITIAPVKTAAAIAVSPTNAKNKNASPTIKTDKVKMTTNAIPTTITIMKTTTTTSTTANATSAMTTTTTAIATTTTVTATSAVTTTTTTTMLTSDKIDRGKDNNLSKFATVLDLAQCLRDVDADLEDYIPSSAENSNDEDNLSDVSSVYCSSVDGCENLSASMKKKLKQKKRKEKQAEKARFDPHKKIKIDTTNKCYVKEETPRFPLVATPRPLWKREKIVYPDESSDEESESDESGTCEETEEDSEENTSTSEEEYEHSPARTVPTTGSSLASSENSAIIRMSTCSNDSGFEGGTAPSSPKKMLGECSSEK